MPEHSRSSFSSVDFLNSVSSPSMASVAIGEKRGQVVNQARIGSKIFSLLNSKASVSSQGSCPMAIVPAES